MNKPVNPSTAKLLKEKGFKEPVVKCYATFKENIVIHSIYNSEIPEDMNGTRHEIIPNVYPNPPYYSAPTIAEVVMWSFNTHKIWITVDVNINGKFNYLLRQFNSKDRAWEVKNPSSIQEYFNYPDDAYISGINYFLNNLEMSK